eukprot:s2518_g1.t1
MCTTLNKVIDVLPAEPAHCVLRVSPPHLVRLPLFYVDQRPHCALWGPAVARRSDTYLLRAALSVTSRSRPRSLFDFGSLSWSPALRCVAFVFRLPSQWTTHEEKKKDGVNIRLEILIYQGQLQTLNGEEVTPEEKEEAKALHEKRVEEEAERLRQEEEARLEAEAAAAEASAAAEAEVLQEGSSGTGHDLDLTICRHLQLARLSLEINN